MRAIVPCLTVVAIVAAALVLAIYQADHPPKQMPMAPDEVIHIADWHWVPEGQHGDGDYAEFLDLVDRLQLQQMDAIRKLDVREVWIEGQSDQSIADFRRHVLKLRDVRLPEGD